MGPRSVFRLRENPKLFVKTSRIRETHKLTFLCFQSLTVGPLFVYKKVMLRIHRSSNDGVNLSSCGRIEIEDVVELQRLLGLESPGQTITLDLHDVTLVDRDAVKFLANCEADSIRLENCPAYIREWIDTERSQNNGREG